MTPQPAPERVCLYDRLWIVCDNTGAIRRKQLFVDDLEARLICARADAYSPGYAPHTVTEYVRADLTGEG